MSLELCVLASGSAGNCSLLRTPVGAALIDAGIGPRTTARRMNGTGVRVADVRAICLTHLDSDHFRPTWIATIVARAIRVFCHESRRDDLSRSIQHLETDRETRRTFRAQIHSFNGDAFQPVPGMVVNAIPLEHDRAGSHAFVIEGFGCRVGLATDLGRVPAHLLDRFCDLDVLAIESNYDRDMQLTSGRPWFLKNRIMGGRGHLSNDQAMQAITAILDRCERKKQRLPEHIVLLHRSRECNCPKLVRKLFARDARVRQRLTLAEQFQRSEWLRPSPMPPRAGEQLTFCF